MSDTAGIHYIIRALRPEAHRFEVTLTVVAPAPEGQVLRLPAWIPGSYMIREFARQLQDVVAWGERGPLEITRQDKDTWRVAPTAGPLMVRYEVYAWDLSVRTAHLDTTHGFFNGTSVFLAVVGQEQQPVTVDIEAGPAAACQGWRVATTLRRLAGAEWGFGRFTAADYDELIDHPVEMGTWSLASFSAGGVVHDVVVTGRQRADLDRLCRDLTPICEQHIRMFGQPAPFERYLFLVMAVGDGYGGLEHRSSTALVCKRTDLPTPGVKEVSDEYRGFLGLCSHEYFHAWNVKRIKPRVFVPYDLTREGYTRLLWAFEGITSYYDDLALVRAGVIGVADWLQLIGITATSVRRAPGRRHMSVAEASFDAWTKYYRQDENSPNSQVSYYTKGALVGLCLDLHLRRVSAGRVSLDDVMRTLWSRYGDGSGVPESAAGSEIEAVAAELAGQDLGAFFSSAVRGTGELPLEDLLGDLGIRLHHRVAGPGKDLGGKAGAENKGLPEPGDLGLKVGTSTFGARVSHVFEDSAAQRAGLSAGDVVIAVDGLQVDGGDIGARLRGQPAGARVQIHAFRRDELMVFEATLAPLPTDTVWLDTDPQSSPEQVARRTAFFARLNEG